MSPLVCLTTSLGVISCTLTLLIIILYYNTISIITIGHKASMSNSMIPSYFKKISSPLPKKNEANRYELPIGFCKKTALFMINNINQFYRKLILDTQDQETGHKLARGHMIYSESSRFPFASVRALTDDDVVLVIMRGTKGKRERSLNLKFQTVKPPFSHTNEKVKFHAGFLKQYMCIRLQLLHSIANSGCSRVIISGHSLGAGVASILVYDLVSSDFFSVKNVYVMNFGSPRAGNKAFAKWVKRSGISMYVIQNTADVFCNLPLSRTPEVRFRVLPMNHRPVFYQYRHAGDIFIFTDIHGVSLMDMHSIKVYENAIKNLILAESSEV